MSEFNPFPTREDFDIGQATTETRDLKPLDRRLRDAGCRIEHRPKGREAVWSHRKWGQADARRNGPACGPHGGEGRMKAIVEPPPVAPPVGTVAVFEIPFDNQVLVNFLTQQFQAGMKLLALTQMIRPPAHAGQPPVMLWHTVFRQEILIARG